MCQPALGGFVSGLANALARTVSYFIEVEFQRVLGERAALPALETRPVSDEALTTRPGSA